jgi:hypothetical protein
MVEAIRIHEESKWNCEDKGMNFRFESPRHQYKMIVNNPKGGRPLERTYECTFVYEVFLTNNPDTNLTLKERAILCVNYFRNHGGWCPGVISWKQDEVLVKEVGAYPWTQEECDLQTWLCKHSD